MPPTKIPTVVPRFNVALTNFVVPVAANAFPSKIIAMAKMTVRMPPMKKVARKERRANAPPTNSNVPPAQFAFRPPGNAMAKRIARMAVMNPVGVDAMANCNKMAANAQKTISDAKMADAFLAHGFVTGKMIAAMDRMRGWKYAQMRRRRNLPQNVHSTQCHAKMRRNNAFHTINFAMAKNIAWMDQMKAADAQGVGDLGEVVPMTKFD